MIDEVLEQTDILEIVEQYLGQLKKNPNGEYRANCPFHEDNTPSLYINTDKQLFNCFGCGESGNVIQFVEKIEGIDFKAALDQLAKQRNIEPTTIIENNNSAKEFVRTIQELKGVTNRKSIFGEHLVAKYTKHQHKYFTSQFKKSTLNKFEIGFCFDDSDELHNRATIPWRDEKGNLLAIIGRDVTGNSRVKYKAKSGSRKMDTLFNIHRAKEYKEIIIVEDEKSVMRLDEFQVYNAVALGGTAFGKRKFLLRRYADSLILALDNDKEGEKAKQNIIKEAKHLFKLSSLNITEYKDIAEITNRGSWNKIIADHKR